MNIEALKQQTADAFKALEKPETQAAINVALELACARIAVGQPDREHTEAVGILQELTGLSVHVCHMIISVANTPGEVIAKPIVLPQVPSEPVVVPKPIAPTGNVEAPSENVGGVPETGLTETQENPSLLQQVLKMPPPTP